MDNTLIKYPGGKLREHKYIKEIIPEYDNYIEPFFGGGGIFFKEEPQKALINDYNSLLMDFYRLVKSQDENFKNYLKQFEHNWDNMDRFIANIKKQLADIFSKYSDDKITCSEIDKKAEDILRENIDKFNGIFDDEFAIDREKMFEHIVKRVTAKLKRMKKVEQKKDKKLPEDDIMDNIKTGFTSGFYNHFRELLNDCNLERRDLEKEKHIAIYYYIREFCYGSMFRYNSKGEFNIPYGGISYNKKDFKSKIDRLFNQNVKTIFENVKIYDLDFEAFLNRIELKNNDFVFFDPPYDTDFSTYGGNPFDKKDHARLADVIENLKANCILIIKNTEFIINLYKDRGLKISSFDKNYTYNVRGRNNRETKHLIISNY